MKKVFLSLIIVCIASMASMAQPYKSLNIVNNSTCTVYVKLYGTLRTAGCLSDYSSTVLAINPGTTSFLSPASVPGGMDDGMGNLLGFTDGFTMATVYNGPTSCAGLTSSNLSNCVPGTVSGVGGVQLKDMLCLPCGPSVTISWMLTSVKSAQLTIN